MNMYHDENEEQCLVMDLPDSITDWLEKAQRGMSDVLT